MSTTLKESVQFLGDVPATASPVVPVWMLGAHALLHAAVAEIERLTREEEGYAQLQSRCYEGFPSVSDGIFDALRESDAYAGALVEALEGVKDAIANGLKFDGAKWLLFESGRDALLDRIDAALAKNPATACQHEWIDATNERVSGTALCRKCHALARLDAVTLAKNPNPPGQIQTEASLPLAGEASGPVGLGPRQTGPGLFEGCPTCGSLHCSCRPNAAGRRGWVMSIDGRHLYDEASDADVRLDLDGNWESDEQRVEYARAVLMTLHAAHQPASPTQRLAPGVCRVWIFDRYRDGQLMAEGARVHAATVDEAIQKAHTLFMEPGCEADQFRLRDAAPAPPEAVAAERDYAKNMADALAQIREIADFPNTPGKAMTPDLMGRLQTIWQIANGEDYEPPLPHIKLDPWQSLDVEGVERIKSEVLEFAARICERVAEDSAIGRPWANLCMRRIRARITRTPNVALQVWQSRGDKA